jgi:hypothetical protein
MWQTISHKVHDICLWIESLIIVRMWQTISRKIHDICLWIESLIIVRMWLTISRKIHDICLWIESLIIVRMWLTISHRVINYTKAMLCRWGNSYQIFNFAVNFFFIKIRFFQKCKKYKKFAYLSIYIKNCKSSYSQPAFYSKALVK